MNQDDNEEGKNAPHSIEDTYNSMITFFDQKDYIVIDNGTGYLKCGFSGEDLPRVTIPTVMGVKEIQVESNQGIEQGLKRYSKVYGYESLAERFNYDTFFPVKRGIIEDFEHMTNCWQHVITHK